MGAELLRSVSPARATEIPPKSAGRWKWPVGNHLPTGRFQGCQVAGWLDGPYRCDAGTERRS
jgi:hypothetical protein